MAIAELDDVQLDLEVDGEVAREQLSRKVWEKGAWATIAVAFRERGRDGEWKPPKLQLLRFRRMRDAWHKQASITLPGAEALELASAVAEWRDHLHRDET